MAVIQYSGLVSQIRGNIQGTVFSKGHAGFTAYKKGTPRQLKTSEQLRVMQGMSTNGHTWNDLDTTEKSVWNDIALANPVPNRIGDTVTLTGYHYYRLITSKVWPLGNTVALVPDPMAGAAQEVIFQVDALVFEQIDSGTLVVQLDISGETINDVSGDLFAVVWISNPVATINSKYWGTFYRVATVPVTGAAGASQPISLALSGEVLPTGFRTFEGAFHVVKLQYIRPESGAVGVEQLAAAPGTLEPVVPIPFPAVIYFTGNATFFNGGAGNTTMIWWWTYSGDPPYPIDDFRFEFQWTAPFEDYPSEPVSGWSDTITALPWLQEDSSFYPVLPDPTYGFGIQYDDAYGVELREPPLKLSIWFRVRQYRISDGAVDAWQASIIDII